MFEVIPVVAYENLSGKFEPRHFRDGYAELLKNETLYDSYHLSYLKNWARLEELEEALLFSVKSINTKFVSIGDLLSTIDKERVYADVYAGNYKYCQDIYRYAYVRLGLKKTSTFNLIGIARAFSCNGKLLPKWSAYSYSQLCEILSMSDEERQKVTPDMTIKQIRELKNVLAKGNKIQTSEYEVVDDIDEVSVPTSEQNITNTLAALLEEGYECELWIDGNKDFQRLAEWLISKGVKL